MVRVRPLGPGVVGALALCIGALVTLPAQAGVTLKPGDLLVADQGSNEIIYVNHVTGAQQVVSSGDLFTNATTTYGNKPFGVAADSTGTHIYVATYGTGAGGGSLISVNPANGQQTSLKTTYNLTDLVMLNDNTALATSTAGLVPAEHINQFAISGSSATWTVPGNFSSTYHGASGLTLDANNNMYVAFNNGYLVKVSSDFSTNTLEASGGSFVSPVDAAMAHNGDVLVLDQGADALFRLDLSGGPVTPTVGDILSSGNNFVSPISLAVSPYDGLIYVLDRNGGTAANPGMIIQVNPSTGQQTVLTAGGNLIDPRGLYIVLPEPEYLAVVLLVGLIVVRRPRGGRVPAER